MNVYHRRMIALVAVLVAALVAAPAAAAPAVPTVTLATQGDGQPLADVCASADTTEPENRAFEQADDVLKEGVDYWAVFCTAAGPIYVNLLEAQAPITVNNFVFLAQQGYYNNTEFHRVLPGFMAQGGDPTGSGSGGPGYQFEDETSNGLVFDEPGLLAMANAGANTNGSQFFITYDMPDWLNGAHTIFGRVYAGIENAELLTPRDPQQTPDYPGAALNTVVIVEDPASVASTPDGAPSLDHLHALLGQVVLTQLNEVFVIDEAQSGAFDLDATLAATDNADLQAFLSDYLPAHDFAGTAAVVLPISECPADPASLPIWLVGFTVSDYSTANAGETIVFDEARAEAMVASGAWESQSMLTDVPGRAFQYALPDHACAPTAIFHHLDLAMGRYVLGVDLILDSTQINATTEPTPEQYLLYVAQDLLLGSLTGTLNRGNVAAAATE